MGEEFVISAVRQIQVAAGAIRSIHLRIRRQIRDVRRRESGYHVIWRRDVAPRKSLAVPTPFDWIRIVIFVIHLKRSLYGRNIRDAFRIERAAPGSIQRGENDRGQKADDGNDHKKLDERESPAAFVWKAARGGPR